MSCGIFFGRLGEWFSLPRQAKRRVAGSISALDKRLCKPRMLVSNLGVFVLCARDLNVYDAKILNFLVRECVEKNPKLKRREQCYQMSSSFQIL